MSEFEISSTCVPAGPFDLDSCGIPSRVLEDLVLKHLHPRGSASIDLLARETRLPHSVMWEIVEKLSAEQCIEGPGASATYASPVSRTEQDAVSLTSIGRTRACEAFATSRYLGPAPVSLHDYTEQCRKQQLDGSGISQDELLSAMTGVSLDEATLADLQLALSTGGSLLLSGQSGNGKTMLASRLGHSQFT